PHAVARVAVAAGGADGVAGDEHARPDDDAAVDGVAQRRRHEVAAAEIAHRREAGAHHAPRVLRGGEEQGGGEGEAHGRILARLAWAATSARGQGPCRAADGGGLGLKSGRAAWPQTGDYAGAAVGFSTSASISVDDLDDAC